MDLGLAGRHALVCGGSEGIGRATAIELATLGANVTLLARREVALRDAVAALPCSGEQQHGRLVADVAQTFELAQAVATLATRQPVHILVNNTGGPPGGAGACRLHLGLPGCLQKHLIAQPRLVQACCPACATQLGRIVNVISTSVKEPSPPRRVQYRPRAVASWAKTLSRELVATASPSTTAARLHPHQRLDQILADRRPPPARPRQGGDDVRADVPAGPFRRASEIGGVIAFRARMAAAYVMASRWRWRRRMQSI